MARRVVHAVILKEDQEPPQVDGDFGAARETIGGLSASPFSCAPRLSHMPVLPSRSQLLRPLTMAYGDDIAVSGVRHHTGQRRNAHAVVVGAACNNTGRSPGSAARGTDALTLLIRSSGTPLARASPRRATQDV